MPSIQAYTVPQHLQKVESKQHAAPAKTGKTETKAKESNVDFDKYPAAKKLLNRCIEFLSEIEDLTPGQPLEKKLNAEYGPGNHFYEDFAKYAKIGLKEGWFANIELDGAMYRRSKVCLPCEDTRFCSITGVYMDSQEEYKGQYHLHPYGEINCVITLDDTAEIGGMCGWQGNGWTAPAPGTHHNPATRGGAAIQLFFLPAGRISYKADPSLPQPHCL